MHVSTRGTCMAPPRSMPNSPWTGLSQAGRHSRPSGSPAPAAGRAATTFWPPRASASISTARVASRRARPFRSTSRRSRRARNGTRLALAKAGEHRDRQGAGHDESLVLAGGAGTDRTRGLGRADAGLDARGQGRPALARQPVRTGSRAGRTARRACRAHRPGRQPVRQLSSHRGRTCRQGDARCRPARGGREGERHARQGPGHAGRDGVRPAHRLAAGQRQRSGQRDGRARSAPARTGRPRHSQHHARRQRQAGDRPPHARPDRAGHRREPARSAEPHRFRAARSTIRLSASGCRPSRGGSPRAATASPSSASRRRRAMAARSR